MKILDNEFVYRRCLMDSLNEICDIQEEAFISLENQEILRKNSPEILKECLEDPHYTMGAFHNGQLAGFAIMYEGGLSAENIGRDIGLNDEDLENAVNVKLVIVRLKYRGNGLQRKLMEKLERIAAERQKKILCATVSPYNSFSMRNFETLGYKLYCCKIKYGGLKRNIYYKYIGQS